MRQFSTEGEPNGGAGPVCTVHSMQVVGPAKTTEGQNLEKLRSYDCIKTKEQLTIRKLTIRTYRGPLVHLLKKFQMALKIGCTA